MAIYFGLYNLMKINRIKAQRRKARLAAVCWTKTVGDKGSTIFIGVCRR